MTGVGSAIFFSDPVHGPDIHIEQPRIIRDLSKLPPQNHSRFPVPQTVRPRQTPDHWSPTARAHSPLVDRPLPTRHRLGLLGVFHEARDSPTLLPFTLDHTNMCSLLTSSFTTFLGSFIF